MEIQGCNIVLTGASRGLGAHIAGVLARKGANLAIAARSIDDLDKVRNTITSPDIRVVAIPTDLTDNTQMKSLASKANRELGPIDILINNAGIESTAPFQDQSDSKIEAIVKVNLLAPMLLIQTLLPGMLKRGKGHIVNISSLAGKTGLPFQTAYAATKAGLVMLTHSLRAELVDQPVGASVLCPGFVADEGMYARIEESGKQAPKLLKPTTPDKVSNAVIRAIEQNISEIIVNRVPMRPGILLQEAFPAITPYLHKFIGTNDFGQDLSTHHPDNR